MGGSNQQANAGAMPEVRKATLPNAADYRYESMMAQQDELKRNQQEQLAKFGHIGRSLMRKWTETNKEL